jgi:LacI family transcriptional regulator
VNVSRREGESRLTERPTQRRVTIVDVARHAGVSTAAASKALRNAYGVSESMSERVQASIDALGYRPLKSARGMRGRTFTIGVMLSDLENPFFGLLIDGLTQVLRPQGFDFLVAPAGTSVESQQSTAATLADYQVDGLVLIAPRLSDSELEDIGAATPTVVIGRHGPATNYDTVSGDDALGSALIVDHLVALGHERIGFITAEAKGESPRTPQSVRAEGFVAAMRAHGLADSMTMIAALQHCTPAPT